MTGSKSSVEIPLMDLAAEYRSLQPEIDDAIKGVLESGRYILGPNVAALEAEVADYLGVDHAVGVASGTDALTLSLRALDIGPGDEVIVPDFTFFATVEAVLHVGATPVFVDIDQVTYCLDVRQVTARVTGRTRAVIPVHLFGHPADMDPLREIARRYGLKVVEDNAQALGAEYGRRKTGGLGDAGCISFFPSKNLGAFGDGGMVVTNDGDIAERVCRLRAHGSRRKYHPDEIGYNSRLDELQAAILRVKLPHLDRWNECRREMAAAYGRRLGATGIVLPAAADGVAHAYHLYVVRVADRDSVQRELRDSGISTAVYYPAPLHRTAPCRALASPDSTFPNAEAASESALALPMYPAMTEHEVSRVARVLEKLLHEG